MTRKSALPRVDPQAPFHIVAEALRHDDAAWQEMLRLYSERLIALARSRLFDARLRQKLDPEDVVQSVLRTFFRRHRDKPFRLASWEGLWALLMTLTVYRVCKVDRHFSTIGRDRNRELSLHQGAAGAGEEDDAAPSAELIDPNPTPLEAAEFTEMIRERLAALPESRRRVIEMGLLGCDDGEICARDGRTVARVRQIRDDVIQELLGLLDGADGSASPA